MILHTQFPWVSSHMHCNASHVNPKSVANKAEVQNSNVIWKYSPNLPVFHITLHAMESTQVLQFFLTGSLEFRLCFSI